MWEDTGATITWLSRPNKSLDGQIPLVLCETESGKKQVQRVLHALEWGNST
ncbi:antitoxin Xre/MbcA/ParS toxin-binding domain-containing protein [Vreelandella aquamarina]|uniref:antitoxin Xre/MbcA/ParS toxin-binding domain-containing protein n=1 Tax=Vreelandella aquamarina TaxID=77097 RepID=UPI0036F30DA8